MNLFAKLEYYNPTGSIKDRPAAYIVRRLLLERAIDRGTTLVESSSGNFGIALAAVCRAEGLRFICVVDPMILEHNLLLLKQYGAEVEMVSSRDDAGGYLKARIARVNEIVASDQKSFWVNQYANEKNAESHYFGTGMEIYKTFADRGLDYAFVPVSSGGTITGVSQILKRLFPAIRIVAVDVAGSVIFNRPPKPRHIPGMGSSIRPEILTGAVIDEVLVVEEEDVVDGCMQLLRRFGILAGGSSGAVYCAALKKFSGGFVPAIEPLYPRRSGEPDSRSNAVMVFPDRGDRYCTTIYNAEWVRRVFPGQDLHGSAGNGRLVASGS